MKGTPVTTPDPWPTAVICGSTKWMPALHAAAETYTRRGYAVHMPHLAGADTDLARTLAAMWQSLIARATVVVAVPKPDGTYGESTAAEVAYAEQLGVPVEQFAAYEPPPIPVLLRAAEYAVPRVMAPSGVAASTVRVLQGQAARFEQEGEVDPHVVGLAMQVINAMHGRNWMAPVVTEGVSA